MVEIYISESHKALYLPITAVPNQMGCQACCRCWSVLMPYYDILDTCIEYGTVLWTLPTVRDERSWTSTPIISSAQQPMPFPTAY